ncbi:MAG: PD-(D/E)XK nuclease family protein [Coriobacteriia bacterium]|nr:PD-(D/E)XK nuclease family protein [Coriobacteriia bacterium]
MVDEATYDVVLLPTFVQVEGWRKAHALQGAGLFGQTVSTFDAWIADLWELYGDGRMLVDALKRAMLMRIAFSQIADGTGSVDGLLTLSPGVARLAASCERQAAGVPEFDAAVDAAAQGNRDCGLSARELALLKGIARYRALLASAGLVELGSACRWLADREHEVFPRPVKVLMEEAAPLDWRISRFFAACSSLEVRVHPASGADGVWRAPDGVEPRLALPAGRYATAGLVMDMLRDLADGERAVITSIDPVGMFRQMEPELSRRGISATVQGMVRFGETDAGRACLLALRVACDPQVDATALTDLISSPFAGLPRAETVSVDARLRKDRLADVSAYTAALREEFPGFASLLDAAGGAQWPAALDALEGAACELPGRSASWRSEQLAVFAALRQVRQMADALHAGWQDCQVVLEQMAVSVSAKSLVGDADEKPRVLVTTQGAAAQLASRSYAMLLACDLTVDAYPLTEKEDAAATLFAKLGLQPAEGVLERSRRTFNKLMRVPARVFACVRPLNDADGNPAYACAMLEEFLDAYRVEDPEDGASGALPAALAAHIAERGEELLYANARAARRDATQPVAACPPEPHSGDVGSHSAEELLPPRRRPNGEGVLRRSPSPSQIEAYLECPYKWFVQNRLKTERLEEGFSQLEKGIFSHAVLERFYRRFLAEGYGKVTAQNLPEARRVLREEADAVEADMRLAEPGSGRYVATNHLEEQAIAQQKTVLSDFLEYESKVLPGFRPKYLEYSFDDNAVDYAGCKMVGTVDRIDVDDAGRAIIIDYKGSVKPEHDIAGKDPANPGKVQARIYAQMVRRALGLDVVGTLYVSYGKNHAVAGAVDGRAVEAAHVPGARKGALWCMAAEPDPTAEAGDRPYSSYDFTDMLDETERLVEEAVSRMERGEVAPNPVSKDACRYCPAAQCPKKGV